MGATEPATEFTLQAWSGGVIGLGRGAQDRAPCSSAGQIGDWLAGAYAAAAAPTAVHVRQLVDVSMLESPDPLSHLLFGVVLRRCAGPTVPRPPPAHDSRCGDGRRRARGAGVRHRAAVVRPVRDGRSRRVDRRTVRPVHHRTGQHPRRADSTSGCARTDVDDILDLSSRIPHPQRTGRKRRQRHRRSTSSSSAARSSTNPRDGFTQPGPPYRTSPSLLRAPQPAPRLGEHTEPLPPRATRRAAKPRRDPRPTPSGAGLPFERAARPRHDDASGPGRRARTCWRMLGAEVIHVESTARPDGTRLIAGVPITEDQWWERSPIFSGLNTNKKSVTLDLADRARARAAAPADRDVRRHRRELHAAGARPDRPRLRLRCASLRARRRSWCACPASGSTGRGATTRRSPTSSRTRPGSTWLTGYPDQNPVEPYCVGDPNAGVHALNALLLALEHRRRTGEGVPDRGRDGRRRAQRRRRAGHRALGLRQPAATRRATAVRPPRRRTSTAPANSTSSAAPTTGWRSRWPPTSSGRAWSPRSATRRGRPTSWPTVDGRRRHHDAIDEHLGTWCATRTGDEIVETLWAAGVPVAKVMQPHRVGDLPQLRAPRLLRARRPSRQPRGTAQHAADAHRVGAERFHRTPAPLLGQHNREVLSGLGLSDDEIAELEDQGVIGPSPGGS